MSTFVPSKRNLREALLFCFNLKKNTAQARELLLEAYPDHTPSISTCEYWFRRGYRFKSGDFHTEDKERLGQPKKFEDAELGELGELVNEDSCQTQEELAESLGVDKSTVCKRLKAMGMIQKQGHWVPYELKLRDVERRTAIFYVRIADRATKSEGFFASGGDWRRKMEKWIHYDNPKRKKSWGHGVCPATHQRRRPSRIFTARKSCSAFGGIRSASYILSCSNRAKQSRGITGDRYRLQLMRLSRAPGIERKTAGNGKKARQGYFAT